MNILRLSNVIIWSEYGEQWVNKHTFHFSSHLGRPSLFSCKDTGGYFNQSLFPELEDGWCVCFLSRAGVGDVRQGCWYKKTGCITKEHHPASPSTVCRHWKLVPGHLFFCLWNESQWSLGLGSVLFSLLWYLLVMESGEIKSTQDVMLKRRLSLKTVLLNYWQTAIQS